MERKGLRNGQFMDEYGVIYSKNGTKLIKSTNLELESYTIREGCKVINHEAFERNKNLKEINIPNSVTTIGVLAFGHCENLTNITIPNGVTTMKSNVFGFCKKLETISIPESVTKIEDCCIYACDNLKYISVAENNEVYFSIDGVLFDKKNNVLICYPTKKEGQTYHIPKGIRLIKWEAFRGSILTNITIPDSVTEIDSAFVGCKNLKDIFIPHSVKKLESYAFMHCHKLQSINVDENNEEYSSIDGVLCNKNKTKLLYYPEGKRNKTYIIPDGITKIEIDAFFQCNHIKEMTIPNFVTKIGRIIYCKNLININVDENNEEYSSIDGVLYNKNKSRILYYPEGRKDENYIIPNSVIELNIPGVFRFCKYPKSITIHNNIQKLDHVPNVDEDLHIEKIIVPKGTKMKFKKLLPPKLRGLLCIEE